MAVLRRVSDETPAPIRTCNPGIPVWLETLTERLMAKDPADRFPRAAEGAGLLGGYLAHLRRPATGGAPGLPRPAGGRGRAARVAAHAIHSGCRRGPRQKNRRHAHTPGGGAGQRVFCVAVALA